ncbi:putative holin [Xanthomonas phage Xp15]|uniref:Putative holin n=1 Tax=Xanthomonas phage Xp15 TaxID=322855 RepID=Q52PP7_9CAUD|nr:putative holin [Xanthomonas phage Xp15]AAX84868.1 putative holin [Xanthomonas phage Xp15]
MPILAQIKAYSEVIKLVVLGALVIILGILCYVAWSSYQDGQDAKVLSGVLAQKAEDTAGVQNALTGAQAQPAVIEHRILETRTQYITQYEKLKNEDAIVAEFANTAVPDSLRKLACERRVARDGLTDTQGGCQRFGKGATDFGANPTP